MVLGLVSSKQQGLYWFQIGEGPSFFEREQDRQLRQHHSSVSTSIKWDISPLSAQGAGQIVREFSSYDDGYEAKGNGLGRHVLQYSINMRRSPNIVI